MTTSNSWIITSITTQVSQYGGDIIKIKFANSNRESAITYIDPNNFNINNWHEIIRAWTAGSGVAVDNLLRVNNKKKQILINADSKPNIVGTSRTHDEMSEALEDVIHEQESLGPLFE